MESMDGQTNSLDCQPPIVPPTSPIEELQLDTLQTEVSESYESPAELSDTDSSIPSSPTILIQSQQESEHSGRQDSAQYPEVPDESTDMPQSQDLIHQPEGQKDSSSQEETPYDYVMTGWDSVQPVAGQKRQHSPEPGMMRTKRGRNVKRTDYYRLHHGMAASELTDPKTWEEAMTCSEATQWRQAANEEFSSLKKKGAIKIISRTDLPKGRSPMKCKWVFKKKFLADESVERWKARCTAKGFTQKFGIDYQETFAPTPRPETGRIMLVLAHYLGWHRRQGDVPTAFLNPDLDIDLYMEMP
ncbi:hypothetical protein K3495_g15008 [Podosphaera aphanis]|nr:hypothetical protein K3495_g15008 [Podosphaera aphanis]